MSCMETVLIVDDETKEIVWTNEKQVDTHCYETFFRRTEPCPFCPKLTEKQLHTWDYYDKFADRWLKIKYYLFRDGDRLLRVGNLSQINDPIGLSQAAVQEISFLQRLLNENQRIKEALEIQATHDSMTGLLNRNRFNLDIASGIYDSPNTGVLYFDLNNLKEVNDKYLHEVGDKVICRLAKAIRQVSEETEKSQCYRVGGDEFVLMISECSKETVEQTLVRFREIISEYESEPPHCITAVGSAFSDKPCNAEKLISQADKSMYLNKKQMKSGEIIC